MKKDLEEKQFQILKAVPEEAELLAGILKTAYNELEDPAWFVADDANALLGWMNPDCGLVWKAVECESGACAGVLAVCFPGASKENLGNDAGLSKEQRMKTAHIESAAILPSFRGYGLQYRMMQMAEEEVRKKGYQYLCCTVHPENKFSRDNMQKAGFLPVIRKEKYGGLLRDIMVKVLS